MAKPFAKAFYKSKAWLQCRDAYIASVQGLCETCLRKGKVRPGKILHHKIELTPDNINDPSITLGWDNLEYDCQECHNAKHFATNPVVREGLCFDKDGDLVQTPPINN